MIAWPKLFSQSAIIFAARMFGAAIMFGVQAAIARSFGQAVFGDFLLVLAATNIVAMLLPLGFQTIGSYFVAEYAVKEQRQSLVRFVRQGFLQIIITLCLLLAAVPLLGSFTGPTGMLLASNWFVILAMAFASALVFLSGSTLVALKRPYVGLAAETLLRPVIVAASFLVVWSAGTESDQLRQFLAIMAGGYLVISLVHGIIAVTAISKVKDSKPHAPGEFKRWWRFAFPWVLISLATDFYFDLDLLHLSQIFNAHDLAVFGVAIRIFTLVAFGITAVYTIIMPHVFEAEAKDDRSLFMTRIADANLVAVVMSLALIAVMALAGPLVLSIFGPDFERGATPLVILSLALFVRSFFGPASLILSLHDRPYAPLPAAACGIALLFSFNQLFVPHYGLNGAACAAVAAIAIWSIVLWLTTRRITGLDVSLIPRLKVLFQR